MCLYYILLHVYHIYLHSFPTRRSSDLSSTDDDRFYGIFHSSGISKIRLINEGTGNLGIETDHLQYGDRSEEHTSELQSPCNVVCRLLLEKKNIYVITED